MSRVLIVTKDVAMGQAIADALVTALNVTVVATGEQAMDLFIQEPADVVFLQHDLAGRNGVTTAEALRSMPGGIDAQIILSATEEPKNGPLGELARRVRPFHVRIAPFDADALGRLIERAAVGPAATRVASREIVAKEIGEPSWEDHTSPERTPAHPALRLDGGPEASFAWLDPDGRRETESVRRLVERVEKDQLIASAGPLRSFDAIAYAPAVADLIRAHATGALFSRRAREEGDYVAVLYFRAGTPIAAIDNAYEYGFESVLRRRGTLAEAQPLSAARIHPVELAYAACVQAREKFLFPFSWDEGDHRFLPAEVPPDDRPLLGLGAPELMILGVARWLSADAAIALLAESLELGVSAEPRALMRFVEAPSAAALGSAWAKLDGRHPLREIVASDGRAAQIIVAMQLLQAIRLGELDETDESGEAAVNLELSGRIEIAREYSAQILLDPDDDDGESFGDRPRETSVVREKGAYVDASGSDEQEETSLLDDRVNRLLSAERHFRRGQHALERSRHSESIEALGRAVELCPSEGLFVAHLAWARHVAEPDDRTVLDYAIAMAERASDLAPDLAVVHVLHGRLLRAASRAEDAVRAYQRALQYAPDDPEALRGSLGAPD